LWKLAHKTAAHILINHGAWAMGVADVLIGRMVVAVAIIMGMRVVMIVSMVVGM